MLPDEIMARNSKTFPESLSPIQQVLLNNKRSSAAAFFRDFVKLLQYGVSLSLLGEIAWKRVQIGLLQESPVKRNWQQAIWWARIRGSLFLNLLTQYQPDLAAFHYHATDTLQHQYWHHFRPDDFSEQLSSESLHLESVIPVAYKAADDILGQILAALPRDALVVLISDHGAQAAPRIWEAATPDPARWVELLDLEGRAVAYRFSDGIWLSFLDASYVSETANLVRKAYVKETGAPLLLPPEVDGAYLRLAVPRDALNLAQTAVCNGKEVPLRALFRPLDLAESGIHSPEGMVVLSGPGIRHGDVQVEDMSILDVTPTLLTAMRLPVGKDMEGRVCREAFDTSFVETYPIRYVTTNDTEEHIGKSEIVDHDMRVVEDRLRHLGYL